MTEKATIAKDETKEETVEDEFPAVALPDSVDVNKFQQHSLNDLHAAAQNVGLRVAGIRSKHLSLIHI